MIPIDLFKMCFDMLKWLSNPRLPKIAKISNEKAMNGSKEGDPIFNFESKSAKPHHLIIKSK